MMERANEASGAASLSRRDDPREPTRAEHQWVHAISASELPEGHRRTVVVGGHTMVLLNSHGRLFAVDNRCPHMGFPLDRGTVQDCILTCHWHHARFDLETGGPSINGRTMYAYFRYESRMERCWSTSPTAAIGGSTSCFVSTTASSATSGW
jgi:nitrite reductase/ring-hydroxylating ferredoxin subunit